MEHTVIHLQESANAQEVPLSQLLPSGGTGGGMNKTNSNRSVGPDTGISGPVIGIICAAAFVVVLLGVVVAVYMRKHRRYQAGVGQASNHQLRVSWASRKPEPCTSDRGLVVGTPARSILLSYFQHPAAFDVAHGCCNSLATRGLRC
jgi:uncharacterized protein YjeT (DUF2065 family)